MANGNEIDVVTLYLARKGLQAAEHVADDLIGWPCSIVVVDKAGAVIAGHRMDWRPPGHFRYRGGESMDLRGLSRPPPSCWGA